MKVKNVKVGVRVKLKEDLVSSHTLFKGMKGTILNSKDRFPCVQWDDWHNGHNGATPSKKDSSWSVHINYIKRIK